MKFVDIGLKLNCFPTIFMTTVRSVCDGLPKKR